MKVHTCMYKCIAGAEGVLESVIQMQKYFPKGRPKRGGRLVFTNILLVCDEEIEKIIRDVKYSLERYKIRIEVQYM